MEGDAGEEDRQRAERLESLRSATGAWWPSEGPHRAAIGLPDRGERANDGASRGMSRPLLDPAPAGPGEGAETPPGEPPVVFLDDPERNGPRWIGRLWP